MFVGMKGVGVVSYTPAKIIPSFKKLLYDKRRRCNARTCSSRTATTSQNEQFVAVPTILH